MLDDEFHIAIAINVLGVKEWRRQNDYERYHHDLYSTLF